LKDSQLNALKQELAKQQRRGARKEELQANLIPSTPYGHPVWERWQVFRQIALNDVKDFARDTTSGKTSPSGW